MSKPIKEVFTVIDRTNERDEALSKPPLWIRLGSAFENRDGSWTVLLNALPLDGRLVIREPRPREARDEAEGG